jgi:hypothetical protein
MLPRQCFAPLVLAMLLCDAAGLPAQEMRQSAGDAPIDWAGSTPLDDDYAMPDPSHHGPAAKSFSGPTIQSIPDIFDSRGSIKPQLKAQLGVGLFQPVWRHEDFKTVVPAAAGPAFGFVGKGDTGDFVYKPALTINFDVAGPELFGENKAFLYSRLELIGKVNHDARTTSGGLFFNTTSTVRLEEFRLRMVEWNSPQHSRRQPVNGRLVEYDARQFTLLLDMSYRDMFQKYDSTLRRGDNTSELRSEARFQGLGVASVAKYRFPLDWFSAPPQVLTVEETLEVNGEEALVTVEKQLAAFALFFHTFGNFAVGENDRFSSLTVTVVSPGAAGSTDQARLDRTEFIASGGFDAGLEWNNVRQNRLFSARIAFTAEASSNIGPIDPRDASPGSNAFLLYGVLVAGGVQF